MKASHCTLKPLSKVCVSGTDCQPARKSIGCLMSGFHTGFGVAMRCWVTTSLQARHRRAVRAVNMQREQVVPAHARRPRTGELSDYASLETRGPIDGIGRRRLVG